VLSSFPSSTEARRFARVLCVLSTFSFLSLRVSDLIFLRCFTSSFNSLPLACAFCRSGRLLWLVACILRLCCLDPCTFSIVHESFLRFLSSYLSPGVLLYQRDLLSNLRLHIPRHYHNGFVSSAPHPELTARYGNVGTSNPYTEPRQDQEPLPLS